MYCTDTAMLGKKAQHEPLLMKSVNHEHQAGHCTFQSLLEMAI